MLQTKQYSFYSGYYLVYFFKLATNDENNDHFSMIGVVAKFNKYSKPSRMIPVILYVFGWFNE